MSGKKIVHIVHCVDAEGPLAESLDATFDRLRSLFGLDLEPSLEVLRRLQAGELDLGGREAAVRRVVDPRLLAYNDSWHAIESMLEDAMSDCFRRRTVDSDGQGWVYNWFCVDHVGYHTNPRRRDCGYHNIFDRYRQFLLGSGAARDRIHFHFHPQAIRREAHLSATHWWASSDSLYQILCRRVIDRGWFPAASRPGFNAIRPDSHWFLEQFVPFDFGSQAIQATGDDLAQAGVQDGRFGDWRRAPRTWSPYHPAADDYQTKGHCRRWIARCLSMGTRHGLLREGDVRQAFQEARDEQPVVLAFTNHDFRDIRPDVNAVNAMLRRVGRDFPDVSFRYCGAVEAMRSALGLPSVSACQLDLNLRAGRSGGHVLEVTTDTPSFGPQPWLALKTWGGTYHHDNFDIEAPFRRWRYVLDEQTLPLEAIERLGVAANNDSGATTVCQLHPASGNTTRLCWNHP